jgi:AraC-like DNA-binding protein
MEFLATTLYALPVYQCFALALLLFAGDRNRTGYSRMIMGMFQLLLAIYFSFNLLYKIKEFILITEVYFFILPVILSFIPVFYLYILSVTTPEFRFRKQHLLHFLPAIFILLLNSPYLFFSQEDKILFITQGFSQLDQYSPIRYLLSIYAIGIYGICNLQLIYYLFRTIRLYKNHKQFIVNHYSYTENININWILVLILAFVSFFILNNVLYIIGFKQHLLSQVFYCVSILVITLYAGIQGMRQKELERKPEPVNFKTIKDDSVTMPDIGARSNDFTLPIDENTEEDIDLANSDNYIANKETGLFSSSGKYSGSPLSSAQKNSIVSRLESLMEEDRIFIIDNLSLEHVAERLGTNTKYISQAINEHYKKNFYNFINVYRIEEAKKLLLEIGNDKYSILGIAHMVGFVSKSTFNVAFKRYTGCTPSEFKKNSSVEDVKM